MEVYKPYPEFPEYYEVSNYGNVRNINTGHILRPIKRSDGYLQVGLSVNGVPHHRYLHRLVVSAFNKIRYLSDDIARIYFVDKNRSNCKLDNLRISSGIYNVEKNTLYHSYSEAAADLHRSISSVYRAVNGLQKTCNGYTLIKKNRK